jgi:hypothetical protein
LGRESKSNLCRSWDSTEDGWRRRKRSNEGKMTRSLELSNKYRRVGFDLKFKNIFGITHLRNRFGIA